MEDNSRISISWTWSEGTIKYGDPEMIIETQDVLLNLDTGNISVKDITTVIKGEKSAEGISFSITHGPCAHQEDDDSSE